MLNALHNREYLFEVCNIMRNFFSPIKSLDYYLKFTFITGITKFAQLSIFSELNNLSNISMLEQYSAICGISTQELLEYFSTPITEFSSNLGIIPNELLQELKDNYDGYHFSEDMTDIYNPFSLISAFGNNKIFPYWFASGTPTFLVNYIAEHPIDETTLRCMQPVSISAFNVSPEV